MERPKSLHRILAKGIEKTIEIPGVFAATGDFTRPLEGGIRLAQFFDPPNLPIDPPSGWLEFEATFLPIEKSVVRSLIGAAKANGIDTLGIARTLSIEELIGQSALYKAQNPNRGISLGRALTLKVFAGIPISELPSEI